MVHMARTGVLEFVQRTRRQLHSSHRYEIARLDAAINSSVTTLTLEWAPSSDLRAGDILNIDLELMRVVSYNSGTRVATVVRGWLDSDAAAHDDAAEILINPRFSNIDVFDAMIDEIHSWGPDLYRVEADEFTLTSGTETVELPAGWVNCYGIIRAVRKFTSTYQDTTAWPDVDIRLTRSIAADWTEGASTSGLLVRLIDAVAEGTLMMTVAMPWTLTSVALTQDLVTDLKVPERYLDMLGMGVKLRLMQDGEWGRAARDVQDDSRRSEETPVGAMVQPLGFGFSVYRNRRQEEVNKLNAQHPIRWT